MRKIIFIIQKEFLQIFRNRQMLPIIFVMPVIQMCVLAFAATMEIRNIDVAVVDSDLSDCSKRLESRLEGSAFFRIAGYTFSMDEANAMLDRDDADAILRIPAGFERSLQREGRAEVQFLVNGVNQSAASLMNAYFTSVVSDFNGEVVPEICFPEAPAGATGDNKEAAGAAAREKSGAATAAVGSSGAAELINAAKSSARAINPGIRISPRYWYNPELDYKAFMVPGILVLLITIVGIFLSSMNVVREKEIGTIEQINVTPIGRRHFIVGKLFPIWVIGLFDFSFGMTLGKLLFDIPIVGSLPLIFLFAAVYLPVVLGFGLYISTLSNTQQQAMFISFFFMVIFILMSGLFTPIESMPRWAQEADRLNPLTYFIHVIRMILLKGSGFTDVWRELAVLAGFGLASVSLAVARYRKTA